MIAIGQILKRNSTINKFVLRFSIFNFLPLLVQQFDKRSIVSLCKNGTSTAVGSIGILAISNLDQKKKVN